MTETLEPAAAPGGRRSLQELSYYAAPAVVFLAIVVQFLRFHEYSLALPESLILLTATGLVGVALGAFARLRPNTLGPVLIVASVAVYLAHSQDAVDILEPVYGSIAKGFGKALAIALIGAILLACASLLIMLLRQHLATIVFVIFGTIVVSSIVLPTPKGGEPVIAGTLPAGLKDLPPVIHIILDEHIGLAGLPPEIAASKTVATTLRDAYADFALFGHAYSRFGETQYSLAALMNGEDVGAMSTLLRYHDARYDLKRSAWFDRLRAEGYALHVYQTPWLDFCAAAQADVCDTYPMFSPNALQRTSLPTLARLRVLLAALNIAGAKPILGPLASTEAFAQLQSDLRQAPRGVAYIAHVLLPHADYLYDGNCVLRDPKDWGTQPVKLATADERRAAYVLYFAQMTCTTKHVRSLFAELKRLGVYDEATIVVHGDHGSRIGERDVHAPAATLSGRDLLDHFSTWLAVKSPGTVPGIRDEPVELQRFFAASFLGRQPGDMAPGEVLIRDEVTNAFAARKLVWPHDPARRQAPDARKISQRGQATSTSTE